MHGAKTFINYIGDLKFGIQMRVVIGNYKVGSFNSLYWIVRFTLLLESIDEVYYIIMCCMANPFLKNIFCESVVKDVVKDILLQ